MIYVYYCRIVPLTDDVYASWLALMPREFMQRLCRMHHRHDAQASLIGRLLLLYGLRELDHGHLMLSEIKYTYWGRPYLTSTQIDFNISHSGEYVVCAIGPEGRIGVDIEQMKPINPEDFTPVFSSEEIDSFGRHPEGSLAGFYELWTQKEALVKAEGSGLSFPAKDIRIENDAASLSGSRWRLHRLPVSDGYKAHLAVLAVGNETFPVILKPLYITEQQLVS